MRKMRRFLGLVYAHYHVFVEDDLGEVVRLAEHVLNVLRAVKTGARVRVGDRLTQQL
jgi:hypothetical protein